MGIPFARRCARCVRSRCKRNANATAYATHYSIILQCPVLIIATIAILSPEFYRINCCNNRNLIASALIISHITFITRLTCTRTQKSSSWIKPQGNISFLITPSALPSPGSQFIAPLFSFYLSYRPAIRSLILLSSANRAECNRVFEPPALYSGDTIAVPAEIVRSRPHLTHPPPSSFLGLLRSSLYPWLLLPHGSSVRARDRQARNRRGIIVHSRLIRLVARTYTIVARETDKQAVTRSLLFSPRWKCHGIATFWSK